MTESASQADQTLVDEVVDPALVEDEGVVIRVKKFTVRDGLHKTQLELDLMTDQGEEASDDLEFLYVLQHWPLILYGTESVEGENAPPWPLELEDFWNLQEELVMNWSQAVRDLNPQYALGFADLKNVLSGLIPARNETPTDESLNDESDIESD